jgi:hypothetical protein
MDDKQYNTLLTNLKNKIPSDCAAYEDIRKKSRTTTDVLGATTFSLSDYEAYRNDIEFVNSFNEQVRVDERNYFEKKYSKNVYNYLLAQRSAFKEQQAKLKEDLICGSYKKTLAELQTKYDKKEACTKDGVKDSGRFMSYLMSQTPIENPETTYKKIEYRNEAHEWLSTINNGLTILYFVLLLVMFGILASTNNLLFKERFKLYLFLGVLPFAFPYLFELLKYLYGYVFPDSPTHGPKNAFLDTKNNNIMVDSFNI